MIRFFQLIAAGALAASIAAAPTQTAADTGSYTVDEIITAGHHFFGGVSTGLARVVERAVSKYGLPNGYILGQEGAGALLAGARYGEGTLYTKNAGEFPIFWQGRRSAGTSAVTAPARCSFTTFLHRRSSAAAGVNGHLAWWPVSVRRFSRSATSMWCRLSRALARGLA
jgi:hypothetical protein